MYWGGIKPNVQQRTAEHELHLSTQAADAMPSSITTSSGEDGPEESNDDVDDPEDDNVSLVNNCDISVPETYNHSPPVNKYQSFQSYEV